MSILLEVIKQYKTGNQNGIYSICSAHPLVLEASLLQALEDNSVLLIEATSNQVDQFGGYTGMKPIDFRNVVLELAKKVNFPVEKLILGGDHLGPNRWQDLPAEKAMKNAVELIEHYVVAGFEKIHLVLKVGPALTFALREGYYGLCGIEQEIFPAAQRSKLRSVLEEQMSIPPENWAKYYHGDEQQRFFARSFSDRIRYYWTNPKIQQAVEKLFANFTDMEISLPLLSQYFPVQYHQVRSDRQQKHWC